MFYGILLTIHIIACLVLIGIVLIQAGRGGGLTESFSKAESIFGTMTNTLLTRATTVLAIVFFITCLSLAFLSKQHSKSLLEGRQSIPLKTQSTKEVSPVKEAPKQDTTSPEENGPTVKTEDNTKSQ